MGPAFEGPLPTEETGEGEGEADLDIATVHDAASQGEAAFSLQQVLSSTSCVSQEKPILPDRIVNITIMDGKRLCRWHDVAIS